jgi:hypothetical protein
LGREMLNRMPRSREHVAEKVVCCADVWTRRKQVSTNNVDEAASKSGGVKARLREVYHELAAVEGVGDDGEREWREGGPEVDVGPRVGEDAPHPVRAKELRRFAHTGQAISTAC